MPELHDDRLMEWNMDVTESLGPCDMIIGRDILKFLKIDLRFSHDTIEWDGAEMPFEDGDASAKKRTTQWTAIQWKTLHMESSAFLTLNVTKQALKRSVKSKLS